MKIVRYNGDFLFGVCYNGLYATSDSNLIVIKMVLLPVEVTANNQPDFVEAIERCPQGVGIRRPKRYDVIEGHSQ